MDVVIVEDDHDLGALLERVVALMGFQVKWVRMPREAVACMAARPAMALIDLGLPRITDGFDLIREAKAVCGETLYVVACTGFVDPEVEALALAAGADAYWIKPFSIMEVRALLERLEKAGRLIRGPPVPL